MLFVHFFRTDFDEFLGLDKWVYICIVIIYHFITKEIFSFVYTLFKTKQNLFTID